MSVDGAVALGVLFAFYPLVYSSPGDGLQGRSHRWSLRYIGLDQRLVIKLQVPIR